MGKRCGRSRVYTMYTHLLLFPVTQAFVSEDSLIQCDRAMTQVLLSHPHLGHPWLTLFPHQLFLLLGCYSDYWSSAKSMHLRKYREAQGPHFRTVVLTSRKTVGIFYLCVYLHFLLQRLYTSLTHLWTSNNMKTIFIILILLLKS